MASRPVEGSQDGLAAIPAGSGAANVQAKEVRVALWPVVVVLYAVLLPREIHLQLGTFEFYSDRIALLLILPYVIRKLMDGAIRLVFPDLMILLAAAWMIAAMVYHYGMSSGLERGGSFAFDLSVGYFLARISFRSLRDMRMAFLLFLPGIFVVALVMVAESISHRLIIHPLSEAIFGKLPHFAGGVADEGKEVRNVFRFGLLRARGPFSHSIHAGLFLSSLLGIYNLCGYRGFPRLVANAVAPLAIFSVSSAAIAALALGYVLIACDTLQRRVRELSWRMLFYAGIFTLTLLQVASNSGVPALITRFMTFNAQTGYYRLLVWEWGSQSVRQHPLFGLGYGDYERPGWMVSGSIDAHWLQLAMVFGIIPALALFIAVCSAIYALSTASARVALRDQKFYRGIAISLFVMTMSMFTVSLWGGVQMWFTLLLGACVACAQRSFGSAVHVPGSTPRK